MSARLFAFALCCAVLPAFAGCEKSDDELMKIAEQQAAHQQLPEAIETYRSVINAHPEGPRAAEALYRSGMILYGQLKDVVGGAQRFSEVAQRYPNAAEAPKSLMVLGFLYAEEEGIRNVDSARKYYRLLVTEYPTHELTAGARIQLEHLGESADSLMHTQPGTATKPQNRAIPDDTLVRSPGARALAH